MKKETRDKILSHSDIVNNVKKFFDSPATTEDIRSWLEEEELAEEFDRWLAEVKTQEAKAERKRALSIIMTNIGQIVWQARHNPEGQAIDMSKMYEAIMGIDDE